MLCLDCFSPPLTVLAACHPSVLSFNIPFSGRSSGPYLKLYACVRACMFSCSVVSNSFRPHRLQPTRLLCPQNSPDKNTGVKCHFLLQRIFPTQGLNPSLLRLLHWQVDSLPLHHLGSLYLKSVKGNYSPSQHLFHFLPTILCSYSLWLSARVKVLGEPALRLFCSILSTSTQNSATEQPRLGYQQGNQRDGDKLMQIRKVEKDFSGLNNWRKETQNKTAHTRNTNSVFTEKASRGSPLSSFPGTDCKGPSFSCVQKTLKKIYFQEMH